MELLNTRPVHKTALGPGTAVVRRAAGARKPLRITCLPINGVQTALLQTAPFALAIPELVIPTALVRGAPALAVYKPILFQFRRLVEVPHVRMRTMKRGAAGQWQIAPAIGQHAVVAPKAMLSHLRQQAGAPHVRPVTGKHNLAASTVLAHGVRVIPQPD